MTLIAVNSTPTACPDCGGPLSMPLGSKARPGMVVQTCKAYQACGRAVWSAIGTLTESPVVGATEGGVLYLVKLAGANRHSRMFHRSAPPRLVAPHRWKRFSDSELARANQVDRKLAAAGGDR